MLEGGNEPVMEALDAAKEELRIAKNELKELKKTAGGKNLKPNITIQIDKNAKNPYATLRSELEHARDMIKGEVPNQAEKHFARYNGMNEAEMASGYVHKKSVGKAKAIELEQYKPIDKKELDNYEVTSHKNDAFGENPDMVEADYTPYTIHNIKNEKGEILAHLQITDGNYIAYRFNNRIEDGAARKLVAKLLYDNKYPSLVWDATTENSVKSYERFCREFPDLVDRIKFTDKYNNVDIGMPSNYTQRKGVLNEEGNSSNTVSERGQILSGDSAPTDKQTLSTTGTNKGTDRVDKSRILPKSNTAANERGSITNIDNETGLQSSNGQPTQLKLDFNTAVSEAKTTEGLVDDITTGAAKANTAEDIDTIINKTIELEPDISGTTWEPEYEEMEYLSKFGFSPWI